MGNLQRWSETDWTMMALLITMTNDESDHGAIMTMILVIDDIRW